MIRFMKNLRALDSEIFVCESYFGRLYLNSIFTHISYQPLRGFVVNVGTQTFFAVTSPHRQIPWLLAFKIAKKFIEIFREPPWTLWRLASYIRRKARKGILDLDQNSSEWVVYGDETVFYEFRDIWMIADA